MSGFSRACLREKAGLIYVAVALLVGAAACKSQPPRSTASTSEPADTAPATLPPAVLPDLSRLEAAAQGQIREQHSSLTSLLRSPSAQPSVVGEAYGATANLLLAADLFEAAEPFYLHAESLQREDFRWPYYLGHIYKAKPDPDQAVASFTRALALRPDDVASLVWLGDLYLERGKPELAEPLFTRALSLQPGTIAAMYGLGQTALAKGEHAPAIEYFERVLAADARASAAHYPLASAYRALGDTARAEQHLRQRGTTEVGPPDPLMVELRGLLHGANAEEARGTRALSARDFPAAVTHFRAAVELAPDNPTLRHKLGTALSLVGDTKGALQQFREAVRLSPAFAEAHYSLGVLLDSVGQQRQAIEHLSTAVRHGPNYPEPRLQLAEALARSQRYNEAREVLAEGAKLYPGESRFSEMLARVDAARRQRP